MDWRDRKRIKQDSKWFLEELGQQFRSIREGRRQPRRVIAKRAGISEAAVKALEDGDPVLIETLLAVLQAMNLKVHVKQHGDWKDEREV